MDKIGRLAYIDAIRALALFGILFVHAHDCFNFYVPNLPYGPYDWIADWLYRELFLSKAFMAFSLLFGVSFSLQMMRSEHRGENFYWRFLWRMVLLFGFGLIHSLFYCGDILIIFAVVSLIPWALWRCSPRVLFIAAFLCLLSPVALYCDLSGNPNALFQWYTNYVAQHQLPPAPSPLSASWAEMAEWNIKTGTQYAWLYMIWSHRLSLVIGMLLLGAALGKGRWLDLKLHLHARIAWISGAAYLCLMLSAETSLATILPTSLGIWCNVALVVSFLSLSSCVLRHFQGYIAPLCAMGRMSLSCYILQSVIMCYVLASYGLGLLMKLNKLELALCALSLYAIQLFLCTLWRRYFKQGPLEGIWRRLTKI